MLCLVDYTYYSKTYGGSSIPESSFNEYSLEASSKINFYTNDRITNDIMNEEILGDKIRNTACQIIDLLYGQNELIAKLNDDKSSIASETVGPHAISYVNKANLQSQRILTSQELDKECYRICYVNLVKTGLMYRGVY